MARNPISLGPRGPRAMAPAQDDDGRTVAPLRETEFAAFQALIHREAGIYLSEAKKPLLAGRLARRLRELGLRSYGEYFQRVLRDGEPERIQLFDAICTNETRFFREPGQFEFLQRRIVPQWRAAAAEGSRPRRVRAWSAGCSTGEEPYSLAMTLLSQLAGWDVEILATDLSTRALERAAAATWPLDRKAEIPASCLKAFMLKGHGAQEGLMRAGPALRERVRFQRLNLNDDAYAVRGPFDVIFCRNVLIYFDAASRPRIVQRLLDHLAPGGHFFLGHAESLSGVTDRVRSVAPTIYVRQGDTALLRREHPAPR